jgi:hypothetical protein
MRNIRKGKSIVSSCDERGVIAHCLNHHDSNISFCLKIDVEKKKLAITSNSPPVFDGGSVTTTDLTFEWNFRE